jgi:ADP-heptose:LPS heptosyltransferase
MAGSRVFIGHDSGPLHLAASVGVVCVGLYGNRHQPRMWHPCRSGHHIIHEMRGVLAIPVDRVTLAVQAQLVAAASEAEGSASAAASADAGMP